jgi:superfamily II DNA or RNA helicase
MTAETAGNTAAWVPVQSGHETSLEVPPASHEIYQRQDFMIEGLEQLVRHPSNTHYGSLLAPRQLECVGKFATAWRQAHTNGQHTMRTYANYTTGGGKSYILAALLEGSRVGREYNGERIGGLVVAPKLIILEKLTELLQDAPFSIGEWFDNTNPDIPRILGQAVVLISDQALGKLPLAERKAVFHGRHIIGADEAHTKTSPGLSKAMERFQPNRISFGLTGSAKFNARKHTGITFGREVDHYPTPEAIKQGDIRPLQVCLISSGIHAMRRTSRDRMADQLRTNPDRNALILELMKFCAEDGRQGLVSCIEASECVHATYIAEQASQLDIHDPLTHQLRKLRAAAIHSYQSRAQNNTALEAYEAGELDFLTYVDAIGTGYHSKKTDALILASAPQSLVDATQHLGRILGPGEVLGLVLELVDKLPIAAMRKLVTSLEVLGVDVVPDRSVIFSPSAATAVSRSRLRSVQPPSSSDPTAELSVSTITPVELPPSLAARADPFVGQPVRNLIIEKDIPTKLPSEAIPNGFVDLRQTNLGTRISDPEWQGKVADAFGIERRRYGNAWCIPQDQEVIANNCPLPDFLTCPPVPLTQAATNLGMTTEQLTAYTLDKHLVTLMGYDATGTTAIIPTTELNRLQAMLNRNATVPFDPQTDYPVGRLGEELGFQTSAIRHFTLSRRVDDQPAHIEAYIRSGHGEQFMCVNVLDKEIIRRHFTAGIPENILSLGDLSQRLGHAALRETYAWLRKHDLSRWVASGFVDPLDGTTPWELRYLPSAVGALALNLAGQSTTAEAAPVPLAAPFPAPAVGQKTPFDTAGNKSAQPSDTPLASHLADFIKKLRRSPEQPGPAVIRRVAAHALHIPSLKVDAGQPLDSQSIAQLTRMPIHAIHGLIQQLPYSPLQQTKTINGKIVKVLVGTQLDSLLILLKGLTHDDVVQRLQVPSRVADAKLAQLRLLDTDPRQGSKKYNLEEWRQVAAFFPFPDDKWLPLATARSGLSAQAEAELVTLLGGTLTAFHTATGSRELYITSHYHHLLSAQKTPRKYASPYPGEVSLFTIISTCGGTAESFLRWMVQKGRSTQPQLRRASWGTTALVLPHFRQELVDRYQAERQRMQKPQVGNKALQQG